MALSGQICRSNGDFRFLSRGDRHSASDHLAPILHTQLLKLASQKQIASAIDALASLLIGAPFRPRS